MVVGGDYLARLRYVPKLLLDLGGDVLYLVSYDLSLLISPKRVVGINRSLEKSLTRLFSFLSIQFQLKKVTPKNVFGQASLVS